MFETYFPFVRYRANVFNWDKIKENIESKNSDDFVNYYYHQDVVDADGTAGFIDYKEKGFQYSESCRLLNQEKILCDKRDLDRFSIGDISEKYIRKTIELCQRENINVKLFISPTYDLELISTENYDSYLSALKDIAREYNVELYDFNLIKNEWLDIKDGEFFMDVGHLNGEGAEIYTPVLWSVLSNQWRDNEGKFFSSYKEKLANEDFEIYGLYYKDIIPSDRVNDDGSAIYTVRRYTVAASRDNVEYRITRTIYCGDGGAEEATEIIQDYDVNNAFELPLDQQGMITVEGRYGGQTLTSMFSINNNP